MELYPLPEYDSKRSTCLPFLSKIQGDHHQRWENQHAYGFGCLGQYSDVYSGNPYCPEEATLDVASKVFLDPKDDLGQIDDVELVSD